MLRVDVQVGPQRDELLGTSVKPTDGKHVFGPGTAIYHNDEPLIIFGRFSSLHEDVKRFLPHVRYSKNQRLTQKKRNKTATGERNVDRGFGFKPMRPVFGHNAGPLTFNLEYPNWYRKLAALGAELDQLYSQHGPKIHNHQMEMLADLNPAYIIPGTKFTQGVINNANSLRYHYDRGNFKGVWSAMAVFMKDCAGGQLSVPSIDARLAIEDETYVLFDGQALIHGVTPIVRQTAEAYRYSIVFYCIEAMKNAGAPEEEIEKIRRADMVKHRKNLCKQ